MRPPRHSNADRDDPQRRAGEHRPAGDQRHRQRGSTLTATAGTWTGIGNSTPTSGSARATARPGSTSPARPARPTRSPPPTSARPSACPSPRPTRSAARPQPATRPLGGERRAGQHHRADHLRRRPAHRRADLGAGHVEREPERLRPPVAALGRRNDLVDIAGATGAGYELAVADVGAKVRLLVTATNPDGASSRASAPTVTVTAAPPVNATLPVPPARRCAEPCSAPRRARGAGRGHLRLPVAARLRLRVHEHRRRDRRDLPARCVADVGSSVRSASPPPTPTRVSAPRASTRAW